MGTTKSATIIRSIFILSSAALLFSCGSDSDKRQKNANVEILFPPAVSLTDGATIRVRGTIAESDSPVSSLTINGIAAISTDNYASWAAEIPLSTGVNSLQVSAKDGNGETLATQAHLQIKRVADVKHAHPANSTIAPPFGIGIAYDHSHHRVLIADANSANSGITSIDTNTSALKAFAPGSIITSYGVAIDNSSNRLWSIHHTVDGGVITARDLDSGATTYGSLCHFSRTHRGIALDSSHNRVLAVSLDERELWALDLTSGECGIISFQGGGGYSIAVDTSHNRALITAMGSAIYATDLSDGTSSLFSAGSDQEANSSQKLMGIAIDAARNQALVVDDESAALYSVNLATGIRTLISDSNTPNSYSQMLRPNAITLGPNGNYALIANNGFGAVSAVDIKTGERVILSQ